MLAQINKKIIWVLLGATIIAGAVFAGIPGAPPLSCCLGLSAVDVSSCENDDCSTVMITDCFVCTKCGDGNCGKGENKANCPKDCGEPISNVEGNVSAQQFKLSAENFNFVFKYGMCNESGGCNELNTLTGVYTKNMCGDSDLRIEMKLSKDETASVYNKLKDLNMLGDFDQGVNYQAFVTPSENFYFTVKNNTGEKILSWNEHTGVVAYQTFGSFLVNLIESKPEFKKLPVPTCVYD